MLGDEDSLASGFETVQPGFELFIGVHSKQQHVIGGGKRINVTNSMVSADSRLGEVHLHLTNDTPELVCIKDVSHGCDSFDVVITADHPIEHYDYDTLYGIVMSQGGQYRINSAGGFVSYQRLTIGTLTAWFLVQQLIGGPRE